MIRVAIFRPKDGHQEVIDNSVLVRTQDADRAAAGLRVAARRLFYASEFGTELTEEELGDTWTPSWVSPVYRSGSGPALVVDCGSSPPEPMTDLMRRIVVVDNSAPRSCSTSEPRGRAR